MIHNRCTFSNKQFVKMQEDPELIPDGETPQTIILYTFDDLIDVARPGDRVEVYILYYIYTIYIILYRLLVFLEQFHPE